MTLKTTVPYVLVGVALSASPFSYLSCSMDGCTPGRTSMSAFMGLPSDSDVGLRWSFDALAAQPQRKHPIRAPSFFGCSSNGKVAACSLPVANGLVVLHSNGSKYYGSDAINGDSDMYRGGVPVVADQGFVGVLDGHNISYLDQAGRVVWTGFAYEDEKRPALYGPAATFSGYLPVATGSGSIGTWDISTGLCWASLMLGETYNDTSHTAYQPQSIASVFGQTMYLPTQLGNLQTSLKDNPRGQDILSRGVADAAPPARLYAADVTHNIVGRISLRWSFDYNGTVAGVGPTTLQPDDAAGPVTLFYGLAGPTATTMVLMALLDQFPEQAEPSLLWSRDSNPSPLGLVQDPRGGVWACEQDALLVRLNVTTGDVLQNITLAGIGAPSSRGLAANGLSKSAPPTLAACFDDEGGRTFVRAIDLHSGSVLWSYTLEKGMRCTGQLTLMDPNGALLGGLLVTAISSADRLEIIALGTPSV